MEDLNFAKRWMTGSLMSDDAYYNRGFEKYEAVSGLKKGQLSIGDFVSIQNRSGVVSALYFSDGSRLPDDGFRTTVDEDEEYDGGVATDQYIVGVEVFEDMRYLPIEYRDNPESYGYTSNGRGMVKTYAFGDIANPSESPVLFNGGGSAQSIVFTGSLMVLRKNTDDPSSWNDVAQAIYKFQDGFASNPVPDKK